MGRSTRFIVQFAVVGCLVGAGGFAAGAAAEGGSEVFTKSPDGKLIIEFALRDAATTPSAPFYRVRAEGEAVVDWSHLGVVLADGLLGETVEVVDVGRGAVHEEFTQFPGKRSHVVMDANETSITLREAAAQRRQWTLVLRAANDGVAFRYHFPRWDGTDELIIDNEPTQFSLPPKSHAYIVPLKGYARAYEAIYEDMTASALPIDKLIGPPLLFHLPGGKWAAVTEANLTEYAGMYLAARRDTPNVVEGRLTPLPAEPAVSVRAPLPHQSPWRVVLVGDTAGRMVESDLILALNRPNAIGHTAWIKPGKTTFPWWNAFYLENVDFKPGLNDATMKHYIDFCAANGIPYHSLDGIHNEAWYGGKIRPYGGADITTGGPDLDLQEVLRYAKEKGVRLRMWMHWAAAEKHMERAFPLYKQWGVEGVMLDFMNRDDQEMNRFLEKAARLAAENHLTLTLHGASKPTGIERTFPNVLNHEAAANLEYNKFLKTGCDVRHQLIVPFARMLAGPLDFHEGSFRAVPPQDFKPRYIAPEVIGTPTRNLAMYVAYQNHLPMICDWPEAYKDKAALAALVQIPDTWDDTHVVAEQVGQAFAVARRCGADYHLGAMTGPEAHEFLLPLKFLGQGAYNAELWVDDEQSSPAMKMRRQKATATDTLKIKTLPGGGIYGKFTPEK